MMDKLEIERKFLVKNTSFLTKNFKKNTIKQGYLNSDKNRAVRVRIKGNKGYLTIKGVSNQSGTSRFEWEKEICVEEANDLLKLCEPGMISKIRYFIPAEKHTYEVDIFEADNQGLIIAEIELNNENELFNKPDWLGEEVTGQKKYYNSQLSKHPYCKW